ncbi:MAG: PAS domain S-box protein [Methylococcaceae bacterium]
MQALIDLLGIKDLIPHGYCLSWSPVLLWLHVSSDILITLAYYSIPFTIVYFIRQRKDMQYPWLGILFAGFIIACGTTHLLSAITIWIPLYWLDGLLKAITAIISIVTAALMLWIVPQALSLPTAKQLQAEIEQRKIAQQAQQEAFDSLQKIAGRVPGMVYQYRLHPDGSSCLPFASEGIQDIFRMSPEEVRKDASKVFTLLHPDDLDGVNASIQKSAQDLTPWHHEFRVKFDDGTLRWLFGNALPEREADGAILWHGFITDITERKLMEAKLDSIFNASVEGIITVDMSNNIVAANAAVETIFGYEPEELVGRGISNLIPLAHFNLLDTLQASSQIQEIDGLHKNGSVVPLDLSIAEYSIDNTHYFTTIVRDVSLRKRQEQQDKEHLNQLAHVTRLGLMGEMASGIAHEVNQPLTAVTTYTQVSLNLIKAEKLDLEKLSEILHKTQQQALRAGRIIHRMREFVKSHTTQHSITDINTLINNAAGLCVDELKENNITLAFELEEHLPSVNVDQVQIEQVIINLIRNSIDALQNSPSNQERRLSIQTELTSNNSIQVRIKDNGSGIDEEQQEKILMPFFTTKSEGMGMGLSISRSLIEAHEGYLHFNSRPGKGTTFYFTLPARNKQ